MMNEAFLRRRASDEFESAAAALLGDAERGIIIVDWFARSRPMFLSTSEHVAGWAPRVLRPQTSVRVRLLRADLFANQQRHVTRDKFRLCPGNDGSQRLGMGPLFLRLLPRPKKWNKK